MDYLTAMKQSRLKELDSIVEEVYLFLYHCINAKNKLSLSTDAIRALKPSYQSPNYISIPFLTGENACPRFLIDFDPENVNKDVIFFKPGEMVATTESNLRLSDNKGQPIYISGRTLTEIFTLCKEQKKESKSYGKLLATLALYDFDLQMRDLIVNRVLRKFLVRYLNHGDEKYQKIIEALQLLEQELKTNFNIKIEEDLLFSKEEIYDKSRIR